MLEPITIEVERTTLILLKMLTDTLKDEPADVEDIAAFQTTEHIALACHRRLQWERLRDGLSAGIGHALVRQALEATEAANHAAEIDLTLRQGGPT